ncbi:MAG: histidine--tRNA ligase [Oscillospiraceae bacterium]|nr:histidine--tRNA ligase [Oscillospiraceae bacterium]
MALLTKAPKGTQDILPADSSTWQLIEDVLRSEAAVNGFSEIRTPVFEHTELFQRSVGETTDVVQKEMYTFLDKGNRSITLRPEGTAGAVRAMLEHALYNAGFPVKLYYLTSCYRYENTQKGRLREFHQFGAEVFGTASPVADAELITMVNSIFERLGLRNIQLELNSIGCPKCRAQYYAVLKDYFYQHKDQLCETCLGRLERNPMRILDCKSPVCSEIAANAPMMKDYLCDDCKEHFDSVQTLLTEAGVEFTINPMIVRGLDYYTRTVFEFVSNDLGAQSTVCGGGRYDGLVEEMGGAPTPALGYAIGLERLLMILEAQKVELPEVPKCEIYLASLGKEAQKKAFALTTTLRECSVFAECDICDRSLKAQMKYANKIGARYSVVIGEQEIANNKAKLKNMETGETSNISLDDKFVEEYIIRVTTDEDNEGMVHVDWGDEEEV